jgi:serine protease Do
VPARDFLQSLNDPPSPEKPLKLPWLGVAQLSGVDKEVSEFLHLNNEPAVQVGAVIPGFNAEKAGLKAGDIIVKCDGKPLERGDEPEEAAMILLRKVRRMAVGSTVSFTVLKPDQPGAATQEVTMTLGERPKQSNEAKRFFASDLGFAAREMVFEDRYDRRLPNDFKGVIIAMVKPSSSAQSAHLQINDVVTQINRTPVTDVDQFKKLYQDFRKASPHEAVVLEARRGVNTEVIRIEPPQ